jgi:hypothetical protein
LQRGLELADVAAEVEVPSKALRAIEWDRLDLLDDPREADPILRRYAAFLEDGPQTVEEPPRRPRRARAERVPGPVVGRRRPRISDLVYVIGAFVNVLVLAALVYVLADPGSEQPGRQAEPPRGVPARPIPDRTDSPTTEVVPRRPAPKVTTREPVGKAPLRPPVRLTVSAVLRDSWIEARAGSSSGPVLFDGTVARGRPLRLSGRRLWLRLGAASNLAFVLNGRQVGQELFGTVDVVATPRGIRPAY